MTAHELWPRLNGTSSDELMVGSFVASAWRRSADERRECANQGIPPEHRFTGLGLGQDAQASRSGPAQLHREFEEALNGGVGVRADQNREFVEGGNIRRDIVLSRAAMASSGVISRSARLGFGKGTVSVGPSLC